MEAETAALTWEEFGEQLEHVFRGEEATFYQTTILG